MELIKLTHDNIGQEHICCAISSGKDVQVMSKKAWLKERLDEGLCVQIMHLGPFDAEPATVALMDEYLAENGYVNDITSTRLHHEIYMSDARKVAPEKWKTVIRHPIKKA